jgi:hypothetical protein
MAETKIDSKAVEDALVSRDLILEKAVEDKLRRLPEPVRKVGTRAKVEFIIESVPELVPIEKEIRAKHPEPVVTSWDELTKSVLETYKKHLGTNRETLLDRIKGQDVSDVRVKEIMEQIKDVKPQDIRGLTSNDLEQYLKRRLHTPTAKIGEPTTLLEKKRGFKFEKTEQESDELFLERLTNLALTTPRGLTEILYEYRLGEPELELKYGSRLDPETVAEIVNKATRQARDQKEAQAVAQKIYTLYAQKVLWDLENTLRLSGKRLLSIHMLRVAWDDLLDKL